MKINKLLESKKIKEGITNTEPVVKFQGKSSHTFTKDKKWEVDFDEAGNILARTRHGKTSYFKGHINDKVNDFPSTDEDNIILAAREQHGLKFGNKEVKEGYSHFEFTSGSNPYITKTKKETDRVKRNYKDSIKFIKSVNGIDYYKVDDGEEKDLFSVNESVGTSIPQAKQLKQVLQTFDRNGRLSERGNWKIANGGYDEEWELYYEGTPVANSVGHEIKLCNNTFDETLIDFIKSVYTDYLEGSINEAFKPTESGTQSVKCYNRYNYTIQELRVDNDNKTFERGNFTAGKADKKTQNRQEYEDIVDSLKELGYTEIKSGYNSMRNKSRKGNPTSVEEGYELSPRIDYNPNHLRDDEGKIMVDKWYGSKWPDDEVGIEQLKGITLDDALKDRKILDHCDTQVRERVYAQLDKYIPLSKDSPMFKEVNESSEGFQKEFYNGYVILKNRAGEGWDIYSYDGTPEKVKKAYLEDEGYATLQAAKDEIDKWLEESKLDESTLSISDLKTFYNTSTSIDKEKYPNFFEWYDDMIRRGKFKMESMNEASYGGAFDIADDQYFTREDLDSFAEEVLNHINETFKTQFDVSACYIDDGMLELEVTNDEYGDYIHSEKIDMRKIKEPWHLKRAYAFEVASQLINDITQSNDGLIESVSSSSHEFDDDVDDLSYYYDDETFKDNLENSPYTEIASKSVTDSDGFITDYTMYMNINTGEYVFVFGDKDVYSPEDGYFDWECDTKEEAEEWFDSYNGFDDVNDDIDWLGEDVEKSPIVHKKSDGSYMVANENGDGYVAYNKDDECVGNITANNENEAKNKFNSNQFDE